jgi:O-succinylbenzoate synthase
MRIQLHPAEDRIFVEVEGSHFGEVAPLPGRSRESYKQALEELHTLKQIEWSQENCLDQLDQLTLLPSVEFGLESALLSWVDPLELQPIRMSALFKGPPEEIRLAATLRRQEGYSSAKLKVSQLSFSQAKTLIEELSDFSLRIDVNRAWEKEESLQFFSQFPLDRFEFVEEPFSNPHDLIHFTHPLGVDESFPHDLSLEDLEALPTLKTLVYKPTLQGGLLHARPLYAWAKERGIDVVLSSSFETPLGLRAIAVLAQRLGITTSLGLGTLHHYDSTSALPPAQNGSSL